MTPIVRLEHINKQFPGVNALTDISLSFYPGEVHALVGENGAGKSTLIKIILGAYQKTNGKLLIDEKENDLENPLTASRLGIEGVHQELMLIPWLSVWQNIFMNREIQICKGIFDAKKMQEMSKKLLADFGINIDVRRPVKEFSASIWKMIDIARVINLKPRVIIFDEPTAILTEPEVKCLFTKIRELRTQGVAIIYISHRLNEIKQIVDRITILRDGCLIKTTMAKELSENDIVEMMVGRNVSNYYSRHICKPGKELVRMEHVNLKKGQKNISLNIHEGEIVGLAGLVGAGRTEVAESLFGMNKILSGDIYLKSNKIVPKNTASMINKGVYLVPENRKYQGLITRFPVACNIGLSVFMKWSKCFYNKKQESIVANEMIKELSIKTPSKNQLVYNLSGGNQQKVVIAKAMKTNSFLMIFDEPTVGVDVGAKEEIHTLMDNFVGKSGGILMISSDLSEIIGMCDRVYIMYEGKVVKEIKRTELNEKNIATYMLGSKQGVQS